MGQGVLYKWFFKKSLTSGVARKFVENVRLIKSKYPLAHLHKNPFILYGAYKAALKKLNCKL